MANLLLTNIQTDLDYKSIKTLLDPANNFVTKINKEDGITNSVSYFVNAPLKGERIYKKNNWLIFFSGDIIENSEVPFEQIRKILEEESFEDLKVFNGIFSITAINTNSKIIYCISDLRSAHPLYYYFNENNFIISTQLSVFTSLLKNPVFNEKWLFNYFFFNYPLYEVTFLKDVYKIPPASVMKYDISNKKFNIKRYTPEFTKKKMLLEEMEGLNYAAKIFNERIPKYFEFSNSIACPITSGWDGRTNLALAPDPKKITAYTYGIYNCTDLREGRRTSRKTKTKHLEIHFDQDFVSKIPEYIYETVYVSSGLQGIRRSSLIYVYSELKKKIENLNLIVSGLSLDRLFRGHRGVPSFMSPHKAKILSDGMESIDYNYWDSFWGDNYINFIEEIKSKLNFLYDKFGDPRDTSYHMLYDLNVAQPNYFGGEVRIADNFSTIRVPAWDYKMADLAFSIKNSTLSFSQYTGFPRGTRDEMIVQAYVINKLAPEFSNILVNNTTPSIVLKGEFLHKAFVNYQKYKNGILKIIDKSRKAPLEDWNLWLNEVHKNFVDDLIFSKESCIQEYVPYNTIKKIHTERDGQLIGKLLTTEIILRLIKNKWERFW